MNGNECEHYVVYHNAHVVGVYSKMGDAHKKADEEYNKDRTYTYVVVFKGTERFIRFDRTENDEVWRMYPYPIKWKGV